MTDIGNKASDQSGEAARIEFAKAGSYSDVDSEPGPRLMRPNWTAEPGWHRATASPANLRFAERNRP